MAVIVGDIYAEGYQDLRDYVQANYKYIALVDNADNEVVRLEIGVDSRANWIHVAGANPLIVQVTVKGSDTEITEPCTLNKAYLYKTTVSAVKMAGGLHTPFTIESGDLGSADDSMVLTYQFELPKLS